MTDFRNPPPFEDPMDSCPKCLRSGLFKPVHRNGDGSSPETITWVHECGYYIVTRTADDTIAP